MHDLSGLRNSPSADSQNIDVTVVIVSWNTRELLRACLQSVITHTRGISYEIVCVDNASTDGSPSMVRTEFPGVKLITNRENKRFILANNQAIEASTARYVLLLNSDTLLLDNAIGESVQAADEYPDGAAFGCKVFNPDRSLQHSCFMFPSALNLFLGATYLYKFFPRSKFFGREFMTWWDHDSVREVEAVSGCYSLVRRRAIEDVGMMDPVYYFYGDDIDWCYRFRRAGWKVRYLPQAMILHFGGQSTGRVRASHALQLAGSVLLFIRLHRGFARFALARLSIALRSLLRGLYWSLRGVFKREDGKRDGERVKTEMTVFFFALFNWRKLLMNPSEVAARLSGRSRDREAVRSRAG